MSETPTGSATVGDRFVGDRIVGDDYLALPDPVAERTFEVLMCLAAEVWTLRDRLRVAEDVLAANGIAVDAALAAQEDDVASLQEMREDRDAFVSRVLRPLRVRSAPAG